MKGNPAVITEGDEMNGEQLDSLNNDLKEIASKYGIKHCSFCGNDGEGDYIVMLSIMNESILDGWPTILNIGRLWQPAREQTRNVLNRIEHISWR